MKLILIENCSTEIKPTHFLLFSLFFLYIFFWRDLLETMKKIVHIQQNAYDSVPFTQALCYIQAASLTKLKVVNYVPNILKQGDSSTNIFSENFRNTLKKLHFQSTSCGRVFFTKIKTITMCYEINVFPNNLKEKVDDSILLNICCRCQNRNPLQTFWVG